MLQLLELISYNVAGMRVCYYLVYGIGPQDLARKKYINNQWGRQKIQKIRIFCLPH